MESPSPQSSLQAGWLASAQKIESPNFDARPETGTSDKCDISLIVIHAISLPPGKFGGDDVVKFFTNQLDPAAHPYFEHIANQRVSAHFFIRRDGTLIQFVSCEKRAWHAGVSSWEGRERCNDFSIGIELEGTDDQGFDDAQYQQLIAVIAQLKAHYSIQAIVGHSDIAPGRKTDPGAFFDWQAVRSI